VFKDQIMESSLLRSIREKITGDSRISNLDTTLTEVDQTIIIDGSVDKPFRKQAMLSIVKNTKGVLGIVDQIRVGPNRITSDIELRKRAVRALSQVTLEPEDWITAEAEKGVVRLNGNVTQTRSKAKAEISIWKLSGVKDCLNEITLKIATEEK